MPKTIRVLLIDDSRHQHELFKCYTAKSNSVEIVFALSLDGGIAVLSHFNPDIIFLDNRLHPFESYIETVPLIRQTGFSGKIVVISADVKERIFEQSHQHSVASCVDKFEFNLSNCVSKITELAA